jgi:hypothetical protein
MQGTPGTSGALSDELFEKIIGAMEVATVYLGYRLGLYRALAERTGTHERYARVARATG